MNNDLKNKYWSLVSMMLKVLGETEQKKQQLKRDVDAMPLEAQRVFYNTEPLTVAADMAGLTSINDALVERYLELRASLSEISSPPSESQTKTAVSSLRIKAGKNGIARIKDLFEQHSRHTELTGYDRDLIQFANMVSPRLTELGISGIRDAFELQKAILLECLKWSPFNPLLWTRWAGAYQLTGGVQAAHYILWEAWRRLPYSPYVCARLSGTIRILHGINSAIAFAKRNSELMMSTEHTRAEYAKLLSRSDEETLRLEAIQTLLNYEDKGRYSNLFARIINKSWTKSRNYAAAELSLISNCLYSKSRGLVFNICRDLLNTYRNHNAALELASQSATLADTQDAYNQLAFFLKSTDSVTNARRAISILRTIKNRYNSKDVYTNKHLFELLAIYGDESELKEAGGIMEFVGEIDDSVRRLYAARLFNLEDSEYKNTSKAILENMLKSNPLDLYTMKVMKEIDENNSVSQELIDSLYAHEKTMNITYSESEQRDEDENLLTNVDLAESDSIPTFISRFGRLREISDYLLYEQGRKRAESMEELKIMFESDPTFAYAKILMIREGVYKASVDELSVFGIALESAISQESQDIISSITAGNSAQRNILTAAKVCIGDSSVINELISFSNSDIDELENSEKILHEELNFIRSETTGTAFEMLKDCQTMQKVKNAVFKAIEGSLYDELLAA